MKVIEYDNIEYRGEKAILEVGGLEVDSIYLPDLVEKYLEEINEMKNPVIEYRQIDLKS